MTLQRLRSTVASLLLFGLVTLTAAMPAPGASSPLVEGAPLVGVTADARVLVTGAAADVRAAVRAVGGTVIDHLPIIGAVVADVPPGTADEVGDAPGVTGVVENAPIELQGASDGAPSHPADAAGPATLGAPQLWATGADGGGVGIAVLDTGVSEVDDLAGRLVGGVDMTPEQDGQDNYGHGTPVASLAAGSTVGVAPAAHVVPVKIAGRDGLTDIVRVLVGLEWIAAHAEDLDIRVVNLSLGATPVARDLVDAAVQRLWDQGLVVVVSAGNGGPDSLGTPGSNTHVVTVGASRGRNTAGTGDDVIAPWSSDGVDADGNAKPDVVAPGQSVVAVGAPGSWGYENHPESHLGEGRQRISGTSFSAGLVSGAAALVLDAHPEWTPDEVLGQLLASGRSVRGTAVTTPWLPDAIGSGAPVAANQDASALTLSHVRHGLSDDDEAITEHLAALRAEGTAELDSFLTGLHVPDWSGSGWYGSGWYGSGWYGSGWYGSGWYGSGWYGSGWYGSGWYGSGWY